MTLMWIMYRQLAREWVKGCVDVRVACGHLVCRAVPGPGPVVMYGTPHRHLAGILTAHHIGLLVCGGRCLSHGGVCVCGA